MVTFIKAVSVRESMSDECKKQQCRNRCESDSCVNDELDQCRQRKNARRGQQSD
jgi:hypothetical protein